MHSDVKTQVVPLMHYSHHRDDSFTPCLRQFHFMSTTVSLHVDDGFTLCLWQFHFMSTTVSLHGDDAFTHTKCMKVFGDLLVMRFASTGNASCFIGREH